MNKPPAAPGNVVFRWLGEATVIIVSILFALWADAWWQDRQDRGEERVLLEALEAEFRINESYLASFADSVATASLGIGAMARMTEAELASAMNNQFVEWIQRPFTAELRVGALEGALGTERIGLIRSPEMIVRPVVFVY